MAGGFLCDSFVPSDGSFCGDVCSGTDKYRSGTEQKQEYG